MSDKAGTGTLSTGVADRNTVRGRGRGECAVSLIAELRLGIALMKVRGIGRRHDMRQFQITSGGREIDAGPVQSNGLLGGHAPPTASTDQGDQ